jgi:uncharacterized PurR-regulated membrane protein YhhQ (DUF165 family)
LLVVSVIYIAVVAVSNLLVDKFINLGAFGRLSAGTLSFGLTFTLRDLAHQSSVRQKLGRAPIFWMIGQKLNLMNIVLSILCLKTLLLESFIILCTIIFCIIERQF